MNAAFEPTITVEDFASDVFASFVEAHRGRQEQHGTIENHVPLSGLIEKLFDVIVEKPNSLSRGILHGLERNVILRGRQSGGERKVR